MEYDLDSNGDLVVSDPDRWSCKCGRAGTHLSDVLRVVRRDPLDPARDLVECLSCGAQATRYEFFNRR